MSEQQPSTLKSLFLDAEELQKSLESAYDSNSASYLETVDTAVATLLECRKLADQLSLFSPNETVDDISSGDLKYVLSYWGLDLSNLSSRYLLIDFDLAELLMRQNRKERKIALLSAQDAYKRYLNRLDDYELLSKNNKKLFERYLENPTNFSTVASKDPATRRDTKIARFKEEKELKTKLEVRIASNIVQVKLISTPF
jgi:immunoglobulin-binding protein 1